MRNAKGQFLKGYSSSPLTQFQKGTHWRERKPWWDRAWLANLYEISGMSAMEIAQAHGTTAHNILYWLGKHQIPRRSMKEIRAIKHWGQVGPLNPMYGRRGILNANWQGGLTPIRQAIYCKSEMRQAMQAVRKRDHCCRLCQTKDNLEIHHVDPFSQAPLLVMDIGNMILLCKKCHNKLRGKEKHWKRRLFTLLEGR